jgi:exonuclease III
MRIVTWNVHGARKDSPLWEFLSELNPDVLLLQEIGSMPNSLLDSFDHYSRPAVSKAGVPQRFRTGALVKGEIVNRISLLSEYEWANHELEFLKGNFISCTVELNDHTPLNVISVHSPAWPVDKRRLKGIDVSGVKTSTNPNVWGTDILLAALRNRVANDEIWIVGGDYNSSETFDWDWQNRNGKRFGIRSSGNAENLERMRRLGFTECLRQTENDPIIPTFRHSRGRIEHQMDHLFVSNQLYSRLDKCTVGDRDVIFDRALSDHLPIIADFRTAVAV